MRRALALWAVVLVAVLALGWNSPGDAAKERIYSFKSHIIIHADASMTVTEKITVGAAGMQIKRGIIREFPTTYRDRLGNIVKVGFNVKEVLKNGYPEKYQVEPYGNGVKIRIGRADVFLPEGVYTYGITYETNRQLGFFKDYDELYWNVTGTGWTFPIDSVEAFIELPPGAKVLQHAGYTGPQGAKGQDFAFQDLGGDRVLFKATQRLRVREGLTVAVAWPKGLVREPSAQEKVGYFFKDNLGILAALACLTLMLFYYLMVWHRVGRDPAKGVIIPLFTPPKGFTPESVRYLIRMGFDNKTFTAAIINLAVKGYLTIKETGNSYTLRKTNRKVSDVSAAEAEMGNRLFGAMSSVELKDTNHEKIRGARTSLQAYLDKELDKIYFHTNSKYLGGGIVLTLLAFASLALLSDQGVESFLIFLFLAFMISIAVFLGTVVYRQWLQAFGRRIRWGPLLGAIFTTPLALGLIIIILVALFQEWMQPFRIAGVLMGLAVAANGVFYYLLKAPTLLGRQIMDQVEGFKMYLSVAEQERLNLLNPPEKTPELFEKYLPYALALDVEQEWSEQFAEVLAKATVDGKPYQPVWYSGASWDRFHASSFASSMGSAFSSAISSASSPPGSSSGSGGGGSSGGGGGGGGGSGW
ncbi:MAG: DUF2207 domain-containing protein [Deltaproteobacteria bacterium]|nr:DUF2207 domain-containing protein [Deltaproteobacteria bacterium]